MKKKIIAFVIFMVVVGLGIGSFFIFNQDIYEDFGGLFGVYFFNPNHGVLIPEWHPTPEGGSFEADFNTVLGFMSSGNRRSGNVNWSVDPLDLINLFYIDEEYLVIEMTQDFLNMSLINQTLLRSAVTLSLAGVNPVYNIRFVLDSEDSPMEWVESLSTISNNPDISPARIASGQFTLFFPCESGMGLGMESYVSTEVDWLRREEHIMERLITGPYNEGLFSLIPPETQVRSAFSHAETGAIYVDLSADFVNRFQGTMADAWLMIYSITNTLIENTANTSIRRVVFLINSERRADFHGLSGFDTGFTFDSSIILDFGDEYIPIDDLLEFRDDI